MSRTYRNQFYQSCALKTPRCLGDKKAQIENKDLCNEYGVFLGNRALNRKIPNPWDDIVIGSLGESKYTQNYE